MAKKSYGEKFLTSTVNQVGRDLGKVISNQLFGDAHSTPIRRVTQQPDLLTGGQQSGEDAHVSELKRKITIWTIVIVLIAGVIVCSILGI